jgi:hypothetical protein
MKVKIFSPARSAMQSGRAKTGHWIIEYETISKRQPEPLMGWTSSEDTLNQMRLRFPTKDAAIRHAAAQGWQYSLVIDHERRVKPRNYSDNFRYFPPEEAGTN